MAIKTTFTGMLKKRGLYLKLLKYWDLYLLILPVVIYFVIFHYAPLYGIQIAFKRFTPAQGIAGSPWIGFQNFTRFFNSFYFGRLLRNTISLSLLQLLAGFPFPILLAIMISEIRMGFFKKGMQLVFYAPRFISVVVVVSIMSVLFSYSGGIVNILMEKLGGQRVDFMTHPAYFKPIYVISGIWQNSGWTSIIYVATISGIDSEIYEAAIVDGASRVRRIWSITLPCMIPTIVTMFILNMGHIMNIGFDKVYLMQYPMNMETSDIITTFVYRAGIIQGEYHFATAVGLFNNIINFLLLLGTNKLSKKLTDSGLW
ncbi:MAG: ABC transporter permease subunit [Treponema sp.]|nr:ABC transporter permease subunit [Treponema sp.]